MDAASLSVRPHRFLAEAHVLIATELLKCITGQVLVHSDTGSVIVKADDVSNLAQHYYDQGKEKHKILVSSYHTLLSFSYNNAVEC